MSIRFRRTKHGIVIGLAMMIAVALAILAACERQRSSPENQSESGELSEKQPSQTDRPKEEIHAAELPEATQLAKLPVTRVEDLADEITTATQPSVAPAQDQATTISLLAELPLPEICAIFRSPEESERGKIDWAKLAWDSDSAPALSAKSLSLLRAEAPIIDPAALGVEARAGSWLHFWFTHPYFDDRTETAARLLEALSGREINVKNELYGQWQSSSRSTSPTISTHVFCLDVPERLPDFCTVELTYSLGAWANSSPIKPSEIGDPSPLAGVRIPVINEAPDGETVVTALVDQKMSELLQFELVVVLLDGRELTPASSNAQATIERQWLRRLLFKAPLEQIDYLRWRTRPIIKHRFANVPLKPPAERDK